MISKFSTVANSMSISLDYKNKRILILLENYLTRAVWLSFDAVFPFVLTIFD